MYYFCKNNGICKEDKNEFICECFFSWFGLVCEDDVDECVNSISSCKSGE